MPSDPSVLPSVDPSGVVVLSGPVYNEIVRRLTAGELHAEPPLSLERNPSGGNSLRLRLTGIATVLRLDNRDGNGFYDGRAFMGQATQIRGASNTLSLPMGMTDPAPGNTNFTNALVFNPAESAPAGGTSGAASLNPTPANPLWGAGLKVAVTTESPPRGVYMWLTGSDVGVPQYPGMVLTGGQNSRFWDFGPRAHGAL